MEIFNIHIFEFLLIAGLALVVFGPERLPEVGRFAGKQVARFLAWQQQSPELKMINDVRSEFEQEIASLRDELVRTRKQLDISQEVNLNSIRDELRPMLSLREQSKGAAGAAPPKPEAEQPKTWDEPEVEEGALPEGELFDVIDDPTPAGAELPKTWDAPEGEEGALPEGGLFDVIDDPTPGEADPLVRPVPEGTVQAATRPNRLAATEPTTVFEQRDERLSYLEQRRRSLHDAPSYDDGPTLAEVAQPEAAAGSRNGQSPALAAPAISADELRLMLRQIESLSADLQALISGLQAQGVIGGDWQPDAAVNEQESLSR